MKVASGDVDNLPWIREVARTGVQVQLDTGGASLGEVEAAVQAIEETGNPDIVIHHCPSGFSVAIRAIRSRA
ncbi:MAG: N-acetylneuraminate synthase family protein [Dehalococcoidia bacterium]|nr:N-acetylneuraminate synthase family protein [Dehalococcoidia bacterium]